MIFIELFAGIGGFRYGLEGLDGKSQGARTHRRVGNGMEQGNKLHIVGNMRERFNCIWANEWDKYAASIYRRHYGEIDTRDITTVPSADIPDHDLLTAGFPCQSFSIAGLGGGFDDTRGTLFFEIARVLRDKRPEHFLLENVKGLLSNKSGKTFHTILGVLADLGYRVEWMVLNSVYFGVPQNRERVFIVGHLRERCERKIFPVRGSSRRNNEKGRQIDGKSTASTLRGFEHGWQGQHNSTNAVLDEITKNKPDGQRIYNSDGLAKTLKGRGGGQGGKTGLYKLGPRVRRLTPTECERLQAFPDGWTEYGMEDGELVEISDTQRYKALGNAVTTSVITAIGKAFLEHLAAHSNSSERELSKALNKVRE